jgi:PIN domain nuclease of toxin-antitoxin system
VRLLLDSHVFLWWKMRDPRLSPIVMGAIADATEVYVSSATAWELGLKVSLGKLRLPETVEEGVSAAGFHELPVTFAHTRIAVSLPPLHHDPFDRMLVAQARCESLTLVTHDDRILLYEVPVLRVP